MKYIKENENFTNLYIPIIILSRKKLQSEVENEFSKFSSVKFSWCIIFISSDSVPKIVREKSAFRISNKLVISLVQGLELEGLISTLGLI